ncbi:hypothetical protein KGF57_002812 [Candida theae]|uniref:LicD/FKTN/FKRP nucleotidyltransferase domain-containing protein n=1 Tax=Candida theae TaxID=1198502 RepID=A0AAD5FYB0_9ASCO|nr:uncharacterized protein KGF57_002812 [Candida theae]KAI5958004.1 hypothetical protein KGF57_002812 [Candida theae]
MLVASHIQNTSLKQYIAQNVPIPQLKHLLLASEQDREENDFDTMVVDYMHKQQLQQEQQSSGTGVEPVDEKAKERLKVTRQVLQGTTYTQDESFYTISIPPREQIPPLQPYDPRYTLGLLLKYMNGKLSSQDPQQQQPQQLTIPVFHWSDFVDMSAMENYLFSHEKKPCSYFDTSSKNPKKNDREGLLKWEQYCVSDDDIDRILKDPEAQAKYTQDTIDAFKRIQHERKTASPVEYTTGFHIFAPAGRNKKSLRPIISRSYLHDFMQLPLSMTLLLPGDKSIQINVNQEQQQQQRIKLKDSDLFHEGNININEEIGLLASKLPARSAQLELEKHLQHEQFIDNSAQIVTTLESQATSSSLNQTDKNYLHALKTSLQEHDPSKYFHEAYIVRREVNYALGGHYDWRFFNGIVNRTPIQSISINALLQAFLKLTNQYNLTAWVAHGSLLSWFWNGLQFPWDSDVDVQMPITDLHRLSQLFNQTIVVDLGNDLNKESKYSRFFLDSSTFISHRARGNGRNNIDARFIDLDTGLYIDITGLAVSDMPNAARYNMLLPKHDANGVDWNSISPVEKNSFLQVYNCRNAHFAKLQEISPLRLNSVQGELGYIPEDFETMLHVEYKSKGTSSTLFAGYVFLPKLRIWVSKDTVLKFVTNGGQSDGQGRLRKVSEGDTNIITINLSDDEYIEFLYENEPVLREFIATHKVTMLHNEQLRKLVKNRSSIKKFLKENADIYGFGNGNTGGDSLDNDGWGESLLKTRASLQLDYFVNQVRDAHGGKGYNYNDELKTLNDKVVEYAASIKNSRREDIPGYFNVLKNAVLGKEKKQDKIVEDKQKNKAKKERKGEKRKRLKQESK